MVYDCEIIYRLQDELPGCTVKGGMAVQLHLKDDKLRRLSEDVDVITNRSRDEAVEAMDRMRSALAGVIEIKAPHTPRRRRRDPRKNLSLLTYY